mmetsp:Transcript_7120/g.7464  ORF Transcript_7120/g.7464 Transcript_7120/m.7464 type:complete len:455 (-) Transcript_7120:382-1746(-)
MSTRRIMKGTSPNAEKKLCIFQHRENDILCYTIQDGEFTITKEQLKANMKLPRDSPFTMIRYDEDEKTMVTSEFKNAIGEKPKLIDNFTKQKIGLKEQCEMLNKEAILLKLITQDKLNIFKTGTIYKSAIQLWYDLCKPPIADPIEEQEINILERCHGALMYGIKYEGIGYKYDVCSEYPSLMASSHHTYPIKEGEYKTYTKDEFDKLKFYKFGMYHVKVTNTDYRVFKSNVDNWYTHTDLNFAKSKCNATIELIEDGEVNALLYEFSKSISGKLLFGPYVDFLFKLKKDHKCVKKYLNVLWGGLCKKNIMTVSDNKINAGKIILTVTPGDNGNLLFETVKLSCYYDSDYARIKPFILSYGRIKIANIILQNMNKVIRCHTDGIICKEPITNITFGNELGDLKYEGSSQCKILNSNMYTWREKIEKEYEIILEMEKEKKERRDNIYKDLKNIDI